MNRWAPRIPGSRFLDAFAGSGAVGVEALGRGAEHVTWVEKQGRAAGELRRNVRQFLAEDPELSQDIRISSFDLRRSARRLVGAWDLIFADPPYAFEARDEVVEVLLGHLSRDGELALEHDARRPAGEAPEGFVITDRRRYGDTELTFYGHRF